MIGLESCFGVVNQVLVKNAGMKIEKLIQKLTVNPREIMGFESDLFSLGVQAEVTVFDPKKEWNFLESNIFSRSKNTPFLEKTLHGKIHMVFSKGNMTKIP